MTFYPSVLLHTSIYNVESYVLSSRCEYWTDDKNDTSAGTKEKAERLTCSKNPFNLNVGSIQLLGKLMNSPIWVLVGFGVNVSFGAWKFN